MPPKGKKAQQILFSMWAKVKSKGKDHKNTQDSQNQAKKERESDQKWLVRDRSKLTSIGDETADNRDLINVNFSPKKWCMQIF